MDKQAIDLLYKEIETDNKVARNSYQPDEPYPNPPRNPSPEEFRGPNVKDLIKEKK